MKRIIVVGGMPPPVTGMSAVSAAMLGKLEEEKANVTVIDLAASGHSRGYLTRFKRVPRILSGLICLAALRGAHGGIMYIPLSAGLGQAFDLLFVVLARLRGVHVVCHHHSYRYLDHPNALARTLFGAMGDAQHVVLSPVMSERLRSAYPTVKTVWSISNAVFLMTGNKSIPMPKNRLHTLGFISNICQEKGIFQFLELLKACETAKLPVCGLVAGPFQSHNVEAEVQERLCQLSNVEYIGPVYGDDKGRFYKRIDMLVFPTCYVNEAEPLVIHEAMKEGAPVIAYGRGSIPEIVDEHSGCVMDPGTDFVDTALDQVEQWVTLPEAFREASISANQRFCSLYEENIGALRNLLNDMTAANEE